MSNVTATDENEVDPSFDLDERCRRLRENHPSIIQLEYFYEDVPTEDLTRLCESLHNNTVVDWILMEGCGVTTPGCHALGDMLRINRHMRHIVLNSNKEMGLDGITALMQGLSENNKLETMMLEDVKFSEFPGSLKAVGKALERNCCLKELTLGRNNLGGDEFKEFARSLRNNKSLESIELNQCQLTNADVEVLLHSIENHPTLARVDLTENLLTSGISEPLAKLLRRNNILEDLAVTTNALGPLGAEKVASAMETNETLKKLIMGRNEIGEEGAKAFGKSLPNILGLRELFLASNNLSVEALEAVSEGMRDNISLHSIRLGNGDGGTPIPPEIKKKIQFYQRRNKFGWSTLNQTRRNLPSGLWAEILGKVSREDDPSMLHFFFERGTR